MLKSQMYALICSEQCYIVRQTEDEPNVVTMRISYKNLKEVRAVDDQAGRGYIGTTISFFAYLRLKINSISLWSFSKRLQYLIATFVLISAFIFRSNRGTKSGSS